MSYNPQSGGNTEPTGGNENETRNMGEMGRVSGEGGTGSETGGTPTMPTSGYTPPPPSGGYTPPPPPPAGGYGYGASTPPPPPPASSGMNMGDMRNVNVQGLIQKYINVLTKPNVAVHEAEVPQANWNAVLIGVGAVTAVSFIFQLLSALLFAGQVNSGLADLQRQLNEQGNSNVDVSWLNNVGGASVGGAFFTILWTPIFFFIGAGVLFMMGRLFGGTGSNFMTHSYLLSLSYTPTRIIAAVVSIVPFLGLLSLVLFLYQIFLAGLSLQASQRMAAGRAQMAAWLPTILGILLFCLGILLCAGMIAAIVGGATSR